MKQLSQILLLVWMFVLPLSLEAQVFLPTNCEQLVVEQGKRIKFEPLLGL